MKRHHLATLILGLLPLAAHAQYTGPGVTAPLTSVAAALTAADDALVMLEGTVVRQLGHERYEFRDATGSIPVEIDAKRLPAQSFNDSTKVRLSGEVDRELGGREIDVKQVDILR